jgi:pyridoxine 4-dehydrogenase
VPAEDQIGTLLELRSEGKIRHIGLSEVSVEQIETVRRMAFIVSVQNRYNLADRQSEDVLDYCPRENLEENTATAGIRLDDSIVRELESPPRTS